MLGHLTTAPTTLEILDARFSICGIATKHYMLQLDFRRPSGRRVTEILIDINLTGLVFQMCIDLGFPAPLANRIADGAFTRYQANCETLLLTASQESHHE